MDAWRHHQARPQRENKLAMCPVWTVVYPVGGTKMKTREELVKAVEDAWADGAAWNAAPDADKARIAAWGVWRDAKKALIEFDKEI